VTSIHLVTGGDEAGRHRLVTDLAAAGPTRLLTWGSGLLGASDPRRPGHQVKDADALAPAGLAVLDAAGRQLLEDLELPGDVAADLLSGARDPDLRGLLGVAAALRHSTPAGPTIVVLTPRESDPSRLVSLPARAARTARALVPLLARWDVLVAPPGVGALRRPHPDAQAAAREVADLLEPLDETLARHALVHHCPGPGLVEAARTTDLTIALALMGRTLDAVAAPIVPGLDAPAHATAPRPDDAAGGPPFALRLPLPGLTASEIVLEREGDDLVVSAGRHSRTTRLSALHRRCVVAEARMRSGVLTLALEPDEGEWPR
jgi:hypothetical protein